MILNEKSEMEDLNQRIRTGEVTTRAREELLAALKRANAELQNVISRWGESGKSETAAGNTEGSQTEESPKEA